MSGLRELASLEASNEKVPSYFHQSAAAAWTEQKATECGWRLNLHGKHYGVAWRAIMDAHPDEVIEEKMLVITVKKLPRSRLTDVFDKYIESRKRRLPPQAKIDCTRAKL